MNIVHISPGACYSEGWSYQENLLPKYQAKLGHTVTLIVSDRTLVGTNVETCACTDSMSADGFRVIRRSFTRFPGGKLTSLLSRLPVSDLLEELKPDLIFAHGLVSTTIFQVARYKRRHPACVVVQDNHEDYNIGYDVRKPLGVRWLVVLMRRWMQRLNAPYVTKVYGVTPWRKQYAQEAYGVDPAKTDVLIMGADDEVIDFAHRAEIRERVRARYGIAPEDFLVVTGGKIDQRKNIHLLMRAVEDLPHVKLLVFGKAADDFEDVYRGSMNGNVIDIGWIASKDSYDYFFAADLVCFPGQHSVLWEQACAAKTPCLFKEWEGMDHVDNGGNAAFLREVTAESLREELLSLRFTERYEKMRQAAESEKTDIYLYSRIAEKSLETAVKEGKSK